MWTEEQWRKQKELDTARRESRRALARRIASRAYHLSRGDPQMPEHASDCKQDGKQCTCGVAVDMARPGRAADAPVQALAAHILASKRRMAEQNARRRGGLTKRQWKESRLPEASFDVTCLPKPDIGEEAVVPEVVGPDDVQAPPDATPGCRACAGGDAPCRDARGSIRPGHTINPSGRIRKLRAPGTIAVAPTKVAAQMLQDAAPLAAERLIEGVRSDNGWIATACSRVIVERCISPEVLADQGAGAPLLVFPPGTKMAIGNRELGSAADAECAALPEEQAPPQADEDGGTD